MDLFLENHILSFLDLIDLLPLKQVCKDWNELIEHQIKFRKTVQSKWIIYSQKLKSHFPGQNILQNNIKESFTIATFGIVVCIYQFENKHQVIFTDCFKNNYLVYQFEKDTQLKKVDIFYAPFENLLEIEFGF